MRAVSDAQIQNVAKKKDSLHVRRGRPVACWSALVDLSREKVCKPLRFPKIFPKGEAKFQHATHNNGRGTRQGQITHLLGSWGLGGGAHRGWRRGVRRDGGRTLWRRRRGRRKKRRGRRRWRRGGTGRTGEGGGRREDGTIWEYRLLLWRKR